MSDASQRRNISSHPPFITVVSGIPRSGTSMMMAMLQAGGMPVLSDGRRLPDEHNPRGYLEYEPARNLRAGAAWLEAARGHAVKIVSFHLFDMPICYEYRVLFMERGTAAIAASQERMATALAKAPAGHSAEIAGLLTTHLTHVKQWLPEQRHIRTLFINFEATRLNPDQTARRVQLFLSRPLDVDAMTASVDPPCQRHGREDADPAGTQ